MPGYDIKTILGSKMYLLKDDVGLSLQLRESGIREPASTKMMQKIIKPDWVCIDIGANLGYYALLEAKIAKFVYAIEPVKTSYDTLVKSIELNKYKNIKAYNLAISDSIGKSTIVLSRRHNWATMRDWQDSPASYTNKFKRFLGKVQDVDTTTLDKFVTDNSIDKIDLIRMDVEGYEVNIIKGATDALKSIHKGAYLAIEVHGGLFNNRRLIVKMLKTIKHSGFEIVCGTWKDATLKVSWEQVSRRGAIQVFFRKV